MVGAVCGIFLCPEALAVVLGRGTSSLGTDLAWGELAVVGICAATAVTRCWETLNEEVSVLLHPAVPQSGAKATHSDTHTHSSSHFLVTL